LDRTGLLRKAVTGLEAVVPPLGVVLDRKGFEPFGRPNGIGADRKDVPPVPCG
jgi:hypothetical protein